MTVRVEKDTVITVRGQERGSEAPKSVELREGDNNGWVSLDVPRYGCEVPITDLRKALDAAEKEFIEPPLRAV